MFYNVWRCAYSVLNFHIENIDVWGWVLAILDTKFNTLMNHVRCLKIEVKLQSGNVEQI
jgi:hypothetical protein